MPAQKKNSPSKKARKKGKSPKVKTYYENPLKHIRNSSLRCELLNIQKKIIQKSKKPTQTQNNILPTSDFGLQDSVIILSDNENETSEVCKETNIANGNGTKRTRSSQRASKSLSKRRKQESEYISLDASCVLVSDDENCNHGSTTCDTDRENKAPGPETSKKGGRTETNAEDIVVVWSSRKSLLKENESQSNNNKEDVVTVSKKKNKNKKTQAKNNENTNSKNLKNARKDCLSVVDMDIVDDSEEAMHTDTALSFFRGCDFVLPPPHIAQSAYNPNLITIPCSDLLINYEQGCPSTSYGPFNQNCVPQMQQQTYRPGQLREIVIDGNNVGMLYTNGNAFSEKGIKIAAEHFLTAGHTVKVFIPHYRRTPQHHPLLEKWYKEGIVIFTPSRNIGGKRITSYDDRYILQYATMCGGIVVSADQYRDLYSEKPEWRETIEKRLLIPTFVGDYIMFPEDPLGRGGPKLDQFLRH